MNWERFGALAAVTFLVAFVAAIIYGKYLDDTKDSKCSDSCGIRKALVISRLCNCMTEDGWKIQEGEK